MEPDLILQGEGYIREQKVDALLQKNQVLHDDVVAKQRSIEELQAERDKAQEKAAGYFRNWRAMFADNTALRDKIAQQKLAIDLAEARATELKDRLAAAEARVKELERMLPMETVSALLQAEKKLAAAEASCYLKEKMLVEIHRAAGCNRDGLAGILGWIEDAKEAMCDCKSKPVEPFSTDDELLQKDLADINRRIEKLEAIAPRMPQIADAFLARDVMVDRHQEQIVALEARIAALEAMVEQ